MNKQTIIRGTAYAWSNVVANIGGNEITGFKAIDYGEKQEKVNNYAAGNKPYSRGRGNKEYEGSITLYLEEQEALKASSPTGSLLDIPPFDIVVAFLPEGGKIITHTLKYCEFTERKINPKQGDSSIESDLPLVIGDIDWGK